MQPDEPGRSFPEQEYSGFEFIPPVSTDIVTYEVQLYNPENTGEVYEKFYVKVSLTKIFCRINAHSMFIIDTHTTYDIKCNYIHRESCLCN